MPGELLIFAERSVEMQSETIQPDEVRRNPAGHLIDPKQTLASSSTTSGTQAAARRTVVANRICKRIAICAAAHSAP